MPTERKRAIRTAAAWGADQAAMEALYGVGGYYTSLSLWEAGEQANLTALDEIRTAVCYNDWPSGLNNSVTVGGSTVDATRYMRITVAEGHRHSGRVGDGFRLVINNSFGGVIRLNDAYGDVEWVSGRNDASHTDMCVFFAVGANGRFSRCVAETPGAVSVGFRGWSGTTFNACLAVGAHYGFRVAESFRTYKANNCTSVAPYGFGGGNTSVLLRNCVAYSTIAPYEGVFSASSTNNASSGTSGAPGANPVHSISSSDFANAAANDFHLSSGSVLRGAGVNLYSDFQTDIDGDAWPSTGAWDIGCDYYVAAGGSLTINSITASNITSSGARITLGLTR